MGKCKTKAIQTDLHSSRHNQAYPGIIQAYSKPCVTLEYLEPRYIQNPINQKHIQNPRLIQTSTTSNIYDKAFSENSGK